MHTVAPLFAAVVVLAAVLVTTISLAAAAKHWIAQYRTNDTE